MCALDVLNKGNLLTYLLISLKNENGNNNLCTVNANVYL